jgi:Rrf2 family nitric oxide-sensitive transcriptional repressor
MLALTKRVDYGLMALTGIAGSERPMSARELAERYGLSYPLLANVLKDLSAAGLVDSSRGKNGGYKLAQDPVFLSVATVIAALEGPFQLAACTGNDHAAGCELSDGCTVKWSINRIHETILRTLGGVTVADILSESRVGRSASLSDGSAQSFHEVPLELEV